MQYFCELFPGDLPLSEVGKLLEEGKIRATGGRGHGCSEPLRRTRWKTVMLNWNPYVRKP
jgi:hypothetical protein